MKPTEVVYRIVRMSIYSLMIQLEVVSFHSNVLMGTGDSFQLESVLISVPQLPICLETLLQKHVFLRVQIKQLGLKIIMLINQPENVSKYVHLFPLYLQEMIQGAVYLNVLLEVLPTIIPEDVFKNVRLYRSRLSLITQPIDAFLHAQLNQIILHQIKLINVFYCVLQIQKCMLITQQELV